VNGQFAWFNGARTDAKAGQALMRRHRAPSRPTSDHVSRAVSASGTALAGSPGTARYRFSFNLRQAGGQRNAQGMLQLADLHSGEVSVTTNLGNLQVAAGWASFTANITFDTGRTIAATFIVDRHRTGGGGARVYIEADGQAPAAATLESAAARLQPRSDRG
jgi:hypothetical protein